MDCRCRRDHRNERLDNVLGIGFHVDRSHSFVTRVYTQRKALDTLECGKAGEVKHVTIQNNVQLQGDSLREVLGLPEFTS